MPDDIKQSLEQINEVSRLLLSRIFTVQNKIQDNTANISASNKDEPNSDGTVTDNELTELMSTRRRLIHSLFEQSTAEEISIELNLLNEMISLDTELSNQAKDCKKVLSEQVIRLKKSKKVTKSYQKY